MTGGTIRISATTKLPHRKLGQDGPQVSAIGLGCMSLSGVYGNSDDAAAPDFIRYAIAREKACSPAQLVLAWLLAQGEDIVPIPGTKQRACVEENIGALAIKLSPEELVRISAAIPSGAVVDERYPAGAMKAVYI
jgi:aryl-alcohol dehydrogenase-like predicted oxidoreductase